MKLRFHVVAARELAKSGKYYQQIDPSLAKNYQTEANRLAALISLSHRERPAGYRRANFRDFPYYFAYAVRAGTVHIIAVAHASRLPEYWTNRLSNLK